MGRTVVDPFITTLLPLSLEQPVNAVTPIAAANAATIRLLIIVLITFMPLIVLLYANDKKLMLNYYKDLLKL
jgi:hypothetical protein